MNILQRIFTDYYEEIKYTLHPRDSEMENIDKMLNCGDPSFDGAMYVCTTCHNMKFVPGFICVLHTFGRPLEWNPHIHCILSEGGFSDNAIWRPVKHFNYTYLRNAFQTALLNEMEQHIGPSFKKIKAYIYHKDKNGFYVYAKPNLCDPNTVMKYIGRYLGCPVIALKQIDSYDGENVTFHYNRHEDNAYVKRTIPAIEFIKLLIQHIPEKHFKMIRYYGLYARHREIDTIAIQ